MNYQTIKYPDGQIIEGAFPTLDWFEKIKTHIDFKDKNVVDIGHAEGMYSILAKENGANRVVCVDNNPEMTDKCKKLFFDYGHQSEIYTAKFEDMAFDMDYNIVFCNMILHWLEDPQNEFRRIADATKQYIVVIYRPQNDGYEKGWFPTEEEMERLAKSVGFEVKHKELLMTQDNGKEIILTIFERYKSYDSNLSIVRKNNIHFDEVWIRKIELIKPHIYNCALNSWGLGGYYWSNFINGRDLFGDKPFHPLHGKQRQVFLNNKEKESIKKLIDSILLAGEKTGFYIKDVTKRNIILKDQEAYLVDYDHIGDDPDIKLEIKL